MNIGLMNEMKMVCDAMEIDVFEVINAAATKPFGFSRYTPGPDSEGTVFRSIRFTCPGKPRIRGEHQVH